jgi:hypothetical protein
MNRFRRVARSRDQVIPELIRVLSTHTWLAFDELYAGVAESIHRRRPFRCGQEMLRIRVYEKLHQLVLNGFAERQGKTYRGILNELPVLAEHISAEEARRRSRQILRVSADG